MNSPRFHGQKKPEEDEAEREYQERLVSLSQNFEGTMKRASQADDATSFNTSINDRDSYLGSVKKNSTSKTPKDHIPHDGFSGGLSRIDVRDADDLDSHFKNSTFDREMTMSAAGRSAIA